MTIRIKNPETETMARELARISGKSITEAVRDALRTQLQQAKNRRKAAPVIDELDDIAAHCASLPVQDDRPAEELMGYDENGLPR